MFPDTEIQTKWVYIITYVKYFIFLASVYEGGCTDGPFLLIPPDIQRSLTACMGFTHCIVMFSEGAKGTATWIYLSLFAES